MPKFDVICLAKSQKHGGRCVAFLRIDGRGWIRPVKSNGPLSIDDCRLDTGNEIEIFDVVRIQLKEHRPEPHQPENWLIDSGPWEFLPDSFTSKDYSLLAGAMINGPELLGNKSDKLLYKNLIQKKNINSLGLVMAKNIDGEIGSDITGSLQIRVIFDFRGVEYALAVTDIAVKNNLQGIGNGVFSGEVLGFTPDEELLLTISLGQKFGPFCYKIVASIQGLRGSKVDSNRLKRAIEKKNQFFQNR